jgi:hypothetical protein
MSITYRLMLIDVKSLREIEPWFWRPCPLHWEITLKKLKLKLEIKKTKTILECLFKLQKNWNCIHLILTTIAHLIENNQVIQTS